MEKLKKLRKNYDSCPIPEELDLLVYNTLKENRNKMKNKKRVMKWSMAFASAVMIVATINVSPKVVNAMSDIPVIGSLVKVLNFRSYKVDDDMYNANIEVPIIEGLENTDLQESLNNKYLEENKKIYQDFMNEIEELKNAGGGHLGVDSGYIIKTDNDKILSIGRYVVNTVASSSTTMKYDTVDKENEILITLPSLFKDDSYIELISKNIKEQMKEQMEADSNVIYWFETGDIDPFKEIASNTNFYINEDFKLVISFDKYEVAPGYMGIVEFIIPTEKILDIVANNNYIK